MFQDEYSNLDDELKAKIDKSLSTDNALKRFGEVNGFYSDRRILLYAFDKLVAWSEDEIKKLDHGCDSGSYRPTITMTRTLQDFRDISDYLSKEGNTLFKNEFNRLCESIVDYYLVHDFLVKLLP